MFNAPIPGESLTRQPGNSPWEQPPKYAKVDEALKFYMSRLEDDDTMEDFLYLLDNDMPLDLMVESWLLYGESKGLHTYDTSLLVAPVLHEHFLNLAMAADIEVREFQGATKEDKMRARELNDLKAAVGGAPKNTSSVEKDVVQNLEQASDRLEQPKPKGFAMRRPAIE